MSWHLSLAVISGVLTLVAVMPYVRDMLWGTTRPNLVTWGLWILIQGIFAAAQFAKGASFSIVLPLAEIATVGLVVVLGFFGYGYKKYGMVEGVCFLLSIAAIVLWVTTSNPVLALWFSVAADLAAAVPTLVKSYRDPFSETPITYFLVVFSAVAAGFSTQILDISNLLWPVYIFCLNGTTVILIYLSKKSKRWGLL